MKNYIVYYNDKTTLTGELTKNKNDNNNKTAELDKAYNGILKDGRCEDFSVSDKLDYGKISHIDIEIFDEDVKFGDDGFYILNGGHCRCENKAYAIGDFKERQEGEYVLLDGFMPFCSLCKNSKTVIAIATGMRGDVAQVISIKDNKYRFFVRFAIDGRTPYEDISIRLYTIEDKKTDYSYIANFYREYQMKYNGFVSIKQRIQDENNEDLKYSAESLNVRIRMGWKPVPCTIYEQTPENEPDVHVACSFDDVEKIIEAYHTVGVKKAEFCLVGWNAKGHDGRWPQILPVEESLGGEEGLKKVIKLANKYGYKMTCHTNSTDSYSISEMFCEDDIALKENGEKSVEAERWGGGRTYNICPKRCVEISKQTLSEVAELGFRGLHYIDVITCTMPRECHSKEHPVNKRQATVYFDELFAETKKMFGAIGCEGAYDYSLKNCDSTLYASFANYKDTNDMHPLADKYIPFWHLVYHGIVLSNPYARTINPYKSEDMQDFLKIVEYGGRPHIYYYAQFVNDGTNWIGDGDYRTDSDEKILSDAKEIKALADEYDKLSYLEYEFMIRHTEVEENVFETEYSDGSVTVCDYNTLTYKLYKK